MFRISANVDGAVQALDLFAESLEDVDGLLRQFSKVKRAEVAARFRSGGPGWEPLAPATLEKRDRVAQDRSATAMARATGAMRRKLQREYRRAVRAGNIDAIARRLAIKAEFERLVAGGSASSSLLAPMTERERAVQRERTRITREIRVAKKAANQDRVRALSAQLERFDQQHEPEIGVIADNRLRKSIEKLPQRVARAEAKYGTGPLGGIANSIRATIKNGVLTIESRIPWAGVHNEGGTAGKGAHIPARPFLEWTAADFEEFVAMAQDRHLAAFEGDG